MCLLNSGGSHCLMRDLTSHHNFFKHILIFMCFLDAMPCQTGCTFSVHLSTILVSLQKPTFLWLFILLLYHISYLYPLLALISFDKFMCSFKHIPNKIEDIPINQNFLYPLPVNLHLSLSQTSNFPKSSN